MIRDKQLKDIVDLSGVSFGTSGARGLVTDMTDEVCYAYSAAFLQTVSSEAKKVVVGHDLRPSSPRITAACAAAISAFGRQIVYVGELPTPAIAFYATQVGVPAIVVTGSHIPFDRNGIKFYRVDGEISKADEQAMMGALVDLPGVLEPATLPLPDRHAADAYIKRYLDFFATDALKGFRVAVYEHSSVARDLLRSILEGLGASVISLGRTDTFVPIDTEAVRPEDVAQARQWAEEYDFDAIISTDGDADRPLIGDERGEWLRGDVVGILCAQYLQADVVVTPVSCNTALEKCGSFKRVIRTRIGSPYVIAEMEISQQDGNDVVIGYEANGGFLLGSAVLRDGRCLAALPTRDAVLPILALLVMSREKECMLSHLAQELPARYTASDRVQKIGAEASLSLIDSLLKSAELMKQVMGRQCGEIALIDQTDGLRVTFGSGEIVHLRPSGNAPELRCYTEADTADRAGSLCRDCLSHVLEMVDNCNLTTKPYTNCHSCNQSR